jgi:hypothetical protein
MLPVSFYHYIFSDPDTKSYTETCSRRFSWIEEVSTFFVVRFRFFLRSRIRSGKYNYTFLDYFYNKLNGKVQFAISAVTIFHNERISGVCLFFRPSDLRKAMEFAVFDSVLAPHILVCCFSRPLFYDDVLFLEDVLKLLRSGKRKGFSRQFREWRR